MTDTTQRIELLSAEEESALRDWAVKPDNQQPYGDQIARLLATLDRDRSAANERIAVLEGALRTVDFWGHPYLTSTDDTTCLNCGQIGSYGHSEPEVVTDLLREPRAARAALEAREGEETT